MPTFETFPSAKGIVCFGDSITFMAAARADRGYPSILDELLFDRGVSVGNYGVSGGGFQNARDAYDFYHRSRGLWGACVLVGVNDIAAGLDAATIFAGINSFVQELLSDGLRVVLSTVLPWKNGGGWTSGRQAVTEALNAGLLSLAGTNANLRVLDGYAEFGTVDDPQLLQRGLQELIADSLHLGSYGAQAFARFVLEEGIEPLLAEAESVPNGLRNPAADLVDYLTTKTVGGVVLLSASNLFISRMPDALKTPSPCVAVLNTGGAEPQSMLSGERQSVFSPSVQVLVRSSADDFEAGEALARGVIEWCHQRVLAGYLSWYSRDSQPAYLGVDADQRHQWAINFDAEYTAALG